MTWWSSGCQGPPVTLHNMDNDLFDFQRKLLPEQVALTLRRAGAALAAQELIDGLVVRQLKEFLEPGSDTDPDFNALPGKQYSQDVLSLAPQEFAACLQWLRNADACTDQDAVVLRELSQHVHQLKDGLLPVLLQPELDVRLDLLRAGAPAFRRIDLFWAKIHMETSGISAVADDNICSPAGEMYETLLRAGE